MAASRLVALSPVFDALGISNNFNNGMHHIVGRKQARSGRQARRKEDKRAPDLPLILFSTLKYICMDSGATLKPSLQGSPGRYESCVVRNRKYIIDVGNITTYVAPRAHIMRRGDELEHLPTLFAP